MNYVGKLLSNFRGFYNEINSATLTGAIDVIIVEQEDGSFHSSPFHVRFGKLGVLRSREKIVDIDVNGEPVDLHMKLGEAGEAFFVHEASEEEEIPLHLATSPLPSANSLEMMEQGLKELKEQCALEESEAKKRSIKSASEEVSLAVVSETVKYTNGTVSSETVIFVRHVGCQAQADAAIDVLDSPTDSFYYSLDELPGEEVVKSVGRAVCAEMVSVGVQTHDELSRSNSKRKRRKQRRKSLEEENRNQSSSSSEENEHITVFNLDEEQPFLPNNQEVDKARLTAEWANSQFATEIHPWSDADITPNMSPVSSRPPSPKSDTEVETSKMDIKLETAPQEEAYDWKWGEFPTPVQDKKETTPVVEQGASSYLSQFMRRTKKIRHQPEQEGLYLDDLSENFIDPEVAQLYLYGRDKKAKESKAEEPSFSGTNAEALNIVTAVSEEEESGRGASLPHSPTSFRSHSPPVSDSVCRPQPQRLTSGRVTMSLCGGNIDDVDTQAFQQHQVSYNDFSKEPTMFSNPKLVICIDEKYYTWATAAPQLLSIAAYGQPLPSERLQMLEQKKSSEIKKETKKRGWGIWSWRGSEPIEETVVTDLASESKASLEKKSDQDGVLDSIKTEDAKSVSDETEIAWDSNKKYTKSLNLTSEDVEKLKLKPGRNHVSFSVTSRYQGTAKTEAHIYLWRWDDKIIISDVDGTITRSDVLGQVLPLVGKDWSQHGITSLYNKINGNGYKFIYLSARAIGQSYQTRQMLNNVIQEKNSTLPVGPLLLTPNSLVQAFYREVIEKKPQEFKIGCLNNVKALFPTNINPLYAGFGNKVTDVWAYQAVGIPVTRIFTVNPVGELRVECVSKFMSSYNKLYDIVDHFFPPLDGLHGNGEFNYEFSQFAYWRETLPNIDEEIDSLQKGVAETSKANEAAKKTKKT